MRPNFGLLLCIAALGGCVISPYDEYKGIQSTTSPVSFWGYHAYLDETIQIQARGRHQWINVATATPNANQSLSYGVDFYKWSVSAVIPPGAWEPGRTGSRSMIFSRTDGDNTLMSVRDDVISCYNDHPDDPTGFRRDCGGEESPFVRVYTSNYCPEDDMYREVEMRPWPDLSRIDAVFYLWGQHNASTPTPTLRLAGHNFICTPSAPFEWEPGRPGQFSETQYATQVNCRLTVSNAVRCNMAAILSENATISFRPQAFGSCSTATRTRIKSVLQLDPDRMLQIQAACPTQPPPTTPPPPSTGQPDLSVSLDLTATWSTVRFTITNRGTATASGYNVSYCLDVHCSNMTGPTLAPGQSYTSAFLNPRPDNGGPTVTSDTRQVSVDTSNQVVEMNEWNNLAIQSRQ